ncbi:MAG: aminotransferase class I/II-fold pyridoxal phosphate-dependent enzyme [Lachnospiraceae bacterium]|nr:aminotransferase class I/II-fold pyridoxal phosphate-dependent enzyme [Lachnospiraceae bacterium]
MERFIAKGLTEYLGGKRSVWHMPGHKRKPVYDMAASYEDSNDYTGSFDIKKLDELLDTVHAYDVTEVPGLDDLHNPQDMIKKSQDELARVYETFASYYLVNGSTGGIMAAVAAVANPGDKIIIASNCHKSVHNIAGLRGLKTVFVEPENDKNYGIKKEIKTEDLKTVCELNPDAVAVVITSPTYEGILSDISAISELVHSYGMRLIVDEAHGAHLPFMGKSAIGKGADIVIQSLHKTLPSMTQTAILHIIDKNIEPKVQKYLSVFMSSSPSYIMLCDMERAVDTASKQDFNAYLKRLREFRNKCCKLNNLYLLDKINTPEDKTKNTNTLQLDETRIVFFAKAPLTGAALEKLLSEEFGIITEMSGINYVVLISTFADSEEDFEYLYDSLKKLDDNYDYYIKTIIDIENSSNQVYTFNTNYADKAYIERIIDKLKGMEGKTASDNIFVYPPGTYILKKGDIFSKEKINELILHVRQGRQLHGEID